MLRAFLLIVVGLAGDPDHGKTFHAWGNALAESSERLGVDASRLIYLVDAPAEGDQKVSGRSTREEVTKALDRFAQEAGPEPGRGGFCFEGLAVGHGWLHTACVASRPRPRIDAAQAPRARWC